MLYKFDKEWINLGEGTIMILEEDSKIRFVFARSGVNITAFDFWINFDIQPQVSGKAVRFFAPVPSESNLKLALHALKLVDEDHANLLFDTLKKNIPT